MSALEQLSRMILLCRDFVDQRLSDEEICACFQSLRVLCVADAQNLSSHSGQTGLVTLVSLLSRMGMQVGLRIPEVSILFPQPPLTGRFLLNSLITSSEAIITGAKVSNDDNFKPDVVLVLGNTNVKDCSSPCWRLYGDDWEGAVVAERISRVNPWNAKLPIGSMISAALGSGEAFKFAMRRLRLSSSANRVFLESSSFSRWSFGSISVPRGGIDFGEVDIISGGAITQAAIYALMRMPKARMVGRIFDDDITADSNLNRNMLSVRSDVGRKKVFVVARHGSERLHLEPVPIRFGGPDSREKKLGSRVLVGVDDIPSRWQVQRRAADWLAVGGTSHFSISSSSHRLDEACCGCLHPVDDAGGVNPIPTVSFVSLWAGLAIAVRLIQDCLGLQHARERQHLWLTPLRMDQPRAGMWFPIPIQENCPVPCSCSRALHLRLV